MARTAIHGIYQIQHATSRKLYVGSATNILDRWSAHRWELRSGVHGNARLQNAWSKYGEGAFEFSILETCASWSKEIQLERETAWIQWLQPEYNICPVAMSRLGVKQSPLHKAIQKSRTYAWKVGCVYVVEDVWWYFWDATEEVCKKFDHPYPAPFTKTLRKKFVQVGLSKQGAPQYVLKEDADACI